jgi:16S rRNA (guanine527-N7)-methyltransferase
MAHKNKSNVSPMGPRKGVPHRQGSHKKPQQILSTAEAQDRLADIFYNHDFSHIERDVQRQLVRFYILLMEQQNKENFTRLLTFRDIAIKHFIDSLIVAQITKLSFPLLDMGTGPGFPGIPLRLVIPDDKKIILAEGVQKRVEFLKTVRETLELKNLDILGKNINSDFVYPVNGVITRAVEDVGNTLGNVINCLPVGGKVFLMKGPKVDPEIALAKPVWDEYFKLTENISYSLPHTTNDRRLLVYTKIKSRALGPVRDED